MGRKWSFGRGKEGRKDGRKDRTRKVCSKGERRDKGKKNKRRMYEKKKLEKGRNEGRKDG